MKKFVLLAVASAASIAGLATYRAHSADAAAETRAATVKHLMGGINKGNMPKIATSANKAPATDKEWADLELSAAMINELSFSMMEAGRNRDEVWGKACMDMRDGTATIVKQAQAKSYDGVSEAAKKVGASCKTCHDVHKKAQ